MAILQTTVVLLSGSGSWLVPANCVSIDLIECYGGGGGGRTGPKYGPGPGGGGGAYAACTPFTPVPGSPLYYAVGAAGQRGSAYATDGTSGGDTWVRWDNTNAAPTLLGQGLLAKGAKGGGSVLNYEGGLGGAAANGIGNIKFSGGKGGNCPNYYGPYPGGGGGACGCHLRDGGDGRYVSQDYSHGGGGGGLGDPSFIDVFFPTRGGPAVDGTYSIYDGLSGTEGGGGAGGTARDDPRNPYNGGVLYRFGTYGPAGGGGGGGGMPNKRGGDAGSVASGGFGGGGGGNGGSDYNGSYDSGWGGHGGPGGILITYSYSTEPLPPTSFPGAVIPFL